MHRNRTTPSIVPSVFCRRFRPSLGSNPRSPEEVWKHIIKQMLSRLLWVDVASIYLRANGEIIHTSRERCSSVERSQEWARQQIGLQGTFPLGWVQKGHGSAQHVCSVRWSPELVLIIVRQRTVSCFLVTRGRTASPLSGWIPKG